MTPTLYTHRVTYTVTLTHEVVVEVPLPYPTREALEKDNPDEDPISLIVNDPDSRVISSEIIDTIGDRETCEYTITPGATPNDTPAPLEPSSPTL